jgi:hypothetical protein
MAKKKRTAPLRTATRKPDRLPPARSRPGYRVVPLRSDPSVIEGLLEIGQPEQMLMLLPALLWVDTVAFQQLPSNVCLDAAHTLRQTYRWLGMRADVVPVQLAVEHAAGRRPGSMYGSARPHYRTDSFVGHCVLRLPDAHRFVDATVGQFPQIAAGTGAPIVGLDPSGSVNLLEASDSQSARLVVPREDWILSYLPVESEYASVVYEGPCATPAARAGFYEQGLRFAAQLLGTLTVGPEVTARARQAALPRLGALLDAVTGATWSPADDRLDSFTFPDGTIRQLRNLPLPVGTPPPLPPW